VITGHVEVPFTEQFVSDAVYWLVGFDQA